MKKQESLQQGLVSKKKGIYLKGAGEKGRGTGCCTCGTTFHVPVAVGAEAGSIPLHPALHPDLTKERGPAPLAGSWDCEQSWRKEAQSRSSGRPSVVCVAGYH